MSNRYSSVDRTKEKIYRNQRNTLNIGGSLVLGSNDFDINQILSKIRYPSIKSTFSKKSCPKKLPSLIKKINNHKVFDIYTKYSDLSTTINNAFCTEKDNNEKSNICLKTDSNNETKLKNYYNIIIHSNFSDRTSINNTQSSSITNFIKPIVVNEKIHSPILNKIIPNNRLYQKKQTDNNYSNSLKTIIKEIKGKNRTIDQKSCIYKRIPIIQNRIAYSRKYENEVLDAPKIINNYKLKENELKVPDDDPKEFIDKNKKISINNVLIELMHNENKQLKEFNEIRSKNIKESEEIIQRDINNFENYTYKQRELYYKISDLLYEIKDKNVDIIKLLYHYQIRENTLIDEIFKKIEQIESLRIYAKFVHKVLGGDEKIFEGDLIPDYENDNRPNINILLKKIYEKYGYLLKKRKLSLNSNRSEKKEFNLSDSQTNEDIDTDLLRDPDLMIRKYKELEDQILRVVEKTKLFNKNEIREHENNKQLLRDMKNNIKNLEKEYETHKNILKDYKKHEFGNSSDISEEDFCILANDLCRTINKYFIGGGGKIKKKRNKNIDILELNDDMIQCINIMIKKEGEINSLLEKIEDIKRNDKNIFEELMNKRKLELKIINQEKIFETLRNKEIDKRYKVEERMNKIVIKLKKYEPSLRIQKKEVKPKIDENEIVQKENEELLKYH